jgi:hypothetical protein
VASYLVSPVLILYIEPCDFRINHSLGSYDRTLLLIQIIGYRIRYYDMPSLVLISTRDFPAGRGGGFDLYNLCDH